jgi:hypothetical protein
VRSSTGIERISVEPGVHWSTGFNREKDPAARIVDVAAGVIREAVLLPRGERFNLRRPLGGGDLGRRAPAEARVAICKEEEGDPVIYNPDRPVDVRP